MWGSKMDTIFTDTIRLDISTVEPNLAGPKRPQDRVPLSQVRRSYHSYLLESQANNVITSNEFYIKPFSAADGENMHSIHLDPEIKKFVGDVSPQENKEWLDRLIAHQDKYGFSQWAVYLNDGTFIGKAGLLVLSEDGRTPPSQDIAGQVELSCFLLSGYSYLAQNVIKKISEWAFTNLPISFLPNFQ